MSPRVQSPAAGASIDARGWGWRHSGRHSWAVRQLDLQISPGERVLLLGASGAGKSTLLQALAGVLGGEEEGEEQGRLLVNDHDPAEVRGQVGLLLQDPDSQVILARVGDDVAFGCENLGVPRDEIWRRVHEALLLTGLNLPLDHPTSALSGGQKQRLALAGVLAMQPGLLLLDEPTANLDPQGVQEVRESVARVLEHTHATFVVIEHRVAIWQSLVNRVVVLDAEGGILADGSPERVLHSESGRLSAAGVWVPGVAHSGLNRDRLGRALNEKPLLQAHALDVMRVKNSPVATNINLAVTAGRSLVISGQNGVGKSTLALTLAGLLKPAGGRLCASEAFADGAGTEPITWKSRQLLSRIGTVFQDPEHQFVTGSVSAELAVGPRALKLDAATTSNRVQELLERLRLDHLADANPFTLSGGEKRRLSVATVLATRPALLVLDEPTFGQDFRTWFEVVSMLNDLRSDGTAIVAVSHDQEFVHLFADDEYALQPSSPRARGGVT